MIKCKQCGRQFVENDIEPNVHYSIPEKLCFHCNTFNNSPIGSWHQDTKGNYYRKLYPHPKKCPNCNSIEISYERITMECGEYVCQDCGWGKNALTGEITDIGIEYENSKNNTIKNT